MRTASLSAMFSLVLAHSTDWLRNVNEYDARLRRGFNRSLSCRKWSSCSCSSRVHSIRAVCCTPEGPCFSDHMHSIFGEYILSPPEMLISPMPNPSMVANAAAVPLGQWLHCGPTTHLLSVQAERLLWTSAPVSLSRSRTTRTAQRTMWTWSGERVSSLIDNTSSDGECSRRQPFCGWFLRDRLPHDRRGLSQPAVRELQSCHQRECWYSKLITRSERDTELPDQWTNHSPD